MKHEKIGIFVGRLCPIHVGHMATIDKMIEDVGEENSLIILGSVGQKVTFRVLFSYRQRKKWIDEIYSDEIRVVGAPDFPNDDESWIQFIEDLIYSSFAHKETQPEYVFYGGSIDDVEIFANKGFKTEIVDRTSMPVSATVIRDMALRGMDISHFIDQRIKDDFLRKFAKVMEESEKWETPF